MGWYKKALLGLLLISSTAFAHNPWDIICDLRGEVVIAKYTVDREVFTEAVVVGGDTCMGRCGPGYKGEKTRNTYTQECLSHDLCTRREGNSLGSCEDELWRAAPGFLRAPNCEDKSESRRG